MKLCFSTLGCTENALADSLALARQYGMAGIELRGISGIMENAEIPEFQPECIMKTGRILHESGTAPVVLGTSCMFHTAEKAAAAMEEGLCSIQIAQRLQIPFIRVFGNELTADKAACMARVTEGLTHLCRMGEAHGVQILLEVHGGFNTVETLLPVVEALGDERCFGLIWDIGHTHAPYGADWMAFYQAMRPYIRHVHVKDKRGDALTLPGDGDIPIAPIVRRMVEDGYDGYFSLEWERKWHPELPRVETAIERFVQLMKG